MGNYSLVNDGPLDNVDLELSYRVSNVLRHDHYLNASWSRDYGINGWYYLGVTQAPLDTHTVQLRISF